MTDGNLPGLLGHHNGDRVGFLAKPKGGAVAKPKIAIEVLTLGEWKDAGGSLDAVFVDDQSAVVQNGLGMKDGENEFF